MITYSIIHKKKKKNDSDKEKGGYTIWTNKWISWLSWAKKWAYLFVSLEN